MNYTLEVSFRIFGSERLFLAPATVAVALGGCGPLEKFDPAKRLCNCIDVATRDDATSTCVCAAGCASCYPHNADPHINQASRC